MEEIIVGTKVNVEVTPEDSTADEEGSRAAELDGTEQKLQIWPKRWTKWLTRCCELFLWLKS
jgi:hypothetical protein